jgi:hypothetical protein
MAVTLQNNHEIETSAPTSTVNIEDIIIEKVYLQEKGRKIYIIYYLCLNHSVYMRVGDDMSTLQPVFRLNEFPLSRSSAEMGGPEKCR